MKWVKWVFRIFAVLVVLAVLLLLVARFAGPGIATSWVNSTLKEKFGEESAFEGIDLTLHKGRVRLGALRVVQPAGFAPGDLVRFDFIEADLDLASLSGDTIVIETLRVENPFFQYLVDTEGRTNLEAAAELFASEEEEPEVEEPEEPEEETSTPQKILVRNLEIIGLGVEANSAVTGNPVVFTLKDFNLDLKNFHFDPADPEFGPRILEAALLVTVGSIHASQPMAFEGDALFRLDGINLGVAVSDARPDTLVVESFGVTRPFVSFLKDAKGTSNIDAFIAALAPGSDAEPEPEAPEESVSEEPPSKQMAIALDAFQIEELGLALADANPASPLELAMANLSLHVAGVALDPGSGEIVVDQVTVGNAAFTVKRPKPTAEAAESEAAESDAEVSEDSEGVASESETPAEDPSGGFVLKELLLANLSIDYEDNALADEPVVLGFNPIEVSVRNLDLRPNLPADASPAEIDARFTMQQGEEIQDAEFRLRAKASDFDAAIPSIAAYSRLSGFDLAPFKPLLPQGVITALGGSGIDLEVDILKLTAEEIDGAIAIINNKGNRTTLPLKGAPDALDISINAIMSAMMGKVLDIAGNVAGGAADAAKAVGQGAATAAKDLGQGAAKTASKIGGGLLSGAKGLLSGDLGAAGEGIKEATVDAAGEAGSALSESASNVSETAGAGTSAMTGGAKVAKWRQETASRHATSVEEADSWFTAISLPFAVTEAASE